MVRHRLNNLNLLQLQNGVKAYPDHIMDGARERQERAASLETIETIFDDKYSGANMIPLGFLNHVEPSKRVDKMYELMYGERYAYQGADKLNRVSIGMPNVYT